MTVVTFMRVMNEGQPTTALTAGSAVVEALSRTGLPVL